jgi:hypothetical protein
LFRNELAVVSPLKREGQASAFSINAEQCRQEQEE